MKMKLLAISILSTSLFLQTAIAQENMVAPENNTTMRAETNVNKPADADRLGWLVVLNNNEITIAKEMLAKKNLKPSVKAYAKYLLSQHTRLLNETKRVSKKISVPAVEGNDAIELRQDGEKDVATLKPLAGMESQKTFIDAMIKGHTAALEALEQDIKANKTPELNKLLKNTAKHVSMHLKKAKEIKPTLDKS